MEIKPIAYIKTPFSEKFGIPRQSGRVKSLCGEIIFEKEFRNPDYIKDIEGFSHLWLIFDFSLSHKDNPSATVRPPRLGGNRRVGVFASRSPFRPNPIGLSVVKLEKIEYSENKGTILTVSGVDLLDNTPIFDIKPYLPFADSIPDAVGGYADKEVSHRLEVEFLPDVLNILSDEDLSVLSECIAEDPRPSYQEDGKEYTFSFKNYEISFYVKNNTAFITKII